MSKLHILQALAKATKQHLRPGQPSRSRDAVGLNYSAGVDGDSSQVSTMAEVLPVPDRPDLQLVDAALLAHGFNNLRFTYEAVQVAKNYIEEMGCEHARVETGIRHKCPCCMLTRAFELLTQVEIPMLKMVVFDNSGVYYREPRMGLAETPFTASDINQATMFEDMPEIRRRFVENYPGRNLQFINVIYCAKENSK